MVTEDWTAEIQPTGTILACGRSPVWNGADRFCTALLPVAGKPLLGHRIDEMRDIGLKRIVVVTDQTGPVREALPHLSINELQIDLVHPDDTAGLTAERWLVASAEFFSEPALHHLLTLRPGASMVARDGVTVAASASGSRLGDAISRLRGAHVTGLGTFRTTVRHRIIASERALIDLTVDVLERRIAVNRISGLEVAPGVHLEWCPSLRPSSVRGPIHVADGAMVHSTARVRHCSIGRNAAVLPRARLERCIVLENATVPANLRLRDAIVTESTILFAEDPTEEAQSSRTGALSDAITSKEGAAS